MIKTEIKKENKKYLALRSIMPLEDYTDSHLINLFIYASDQFQNVMEEYYGTISTDPIIQKKHRSIITTVKGTCIKSGITKTIFNMLQLPFTYEYFKAVFTGRYTLSEAQRNEYHTSIVSYLLNKKEVQPQIREQYLWLISKYGIDKLFEIFNCCIQTLFSNDEYQDLEISNKHLSFKRFFTVVQYVGFDNLDKNVFSKELESFPFIQFYIALFGDYETYKGFARNRLRSTEIRSIHEKCKKINIELFYEGALKLGWTDDQIKAEGQKLYEGFNLERIKIGYEAVKKFVDFQGFLLKNKRKITPTDTRQFKAKHIADAVYNGTNNIPLIIALKKAYHAEEIKELEAIRANLENSKEQRVAADTKLKALSDYSDFRALFYSTQSRFNDFRNLNMKLIVAYSERKLKSDVETSLTTSIWHNCGVPMEERNDFFYKHVVSNIILKKDYIKVVEDFVINVPFTD